MRKDKLTQPDPIEPQEDEEAAIEARAHERRIANLFEEHNQSLVRFLSARLHSREEAKELAQEAYVRLLNLDQPDTISYVRAFLFRIAANLATDRLKQRHRRSQLRNLLFFDTGEVGSTPEKGLSAKEELQIVRNAIEELPAKCKTAFLLHKIHDLSVMETADQMNLSIRMVRLYIARALAHCRERLDNAASPAGTI